METRIEERMSKWGKEWVIWHNGIKLIGFFNYRSAYAYYKKLLKDPNYRG